MKITRVIGRTLMSVGVGLALLSLGGARAQTATAVPMTAPQGSAAPAAASGPKPEAQLSAQAPSPGAAPGAAPGVDAAKSGSGQASTATPLVKPSTPPKPAPPPKPPQSALTPANERITDQAIRGDIAFIRRYQERLKALNDRGDNPNTAYHYAKALHWVDFALDEYEMKNRTGIIEQALHEGAKLVEALEQKRTSIPMDTALLPLSERVRTDLWAAADKLKTDAAGFKCSGGDIARLEVQLVWAGHIQKDLGWRSAKPHLQAAERYYRDAAAGAETCPRPLAAVAAKPSAAQPPAAPPAATAPATGPTGRRATEDAALAKLPPAKQIEVLADRVHFAYDRANISAATAPILDRVASVLRSNATVNLTVEGHADERGSDEYNLKLSQRRADAVRAYLMAAGVEAARLKPAALGKVKPEVAAREKSEDSEGHAQNRRVVFVPAAGSGLGSIMAQRQREDLQPEKAPPQSRRP